MTSLEERLRLLLKVYRDAVQHYAKLVEIIGGVDDPDMEASLYLGYGIHLITQAFMADPIKTVFFTELHLLRMKLQALQDENTGIMTIKVIDMHSKSDEDFIDKVVEMVENDREN